MILRLKTDKSFKGILHKYINYIRFDDCIVKHTDNILVYRTQSESATLEVKADGWIRYEGQRALLFSHPVFSMLTKLFLEDRLESIDVYSSNRMEQPAFFYTGLAYMEDLRDAAMDKYLVELSDPDDIKYLSELVAIVHRLNTASNPYLEIEIDGTYVEVGLRSKGNIADAITTHAIYEYTRRLKVAQS